MNNMVFTSVMQDSEFWKPDYWIRQLDRMIDSNSPWETVKVLQESSICSYVSSKKG